MMLSLSCAVLAYYLSFTSLGIIGAYVIPSFFVIFFANIVFTRCFGICLSLFPEMAGTAGALTGTVFIAVGAIATFNVS
jgi:hypothetical protein